MGNTAYESVLNDLADLLNQLEEYYRQNELSEKKKGELQEIFQSEQIQALREHRFRLLAGRTSDILSVHSSKGIVLYISTAIESLTGYKPEEYGRFSFFDNIYKEDLEYVRNEIDKLNSIKEQEVIYEYRLLTKSKKIIWVETKTKFFRVSSKRASYLVSSTRDITDRKEAELKLKESKEQFRTSVENMLDAFGIYSAIRDKKGKIVDFLIEYVNQDACNIHQKSKDEMLGNRLLELFPEDRKNGLFRKYCKVVEAGEPLDEKFLYYQSANGKRYVDKALDIRASRLRDGLVVTWRDITEQRRLQQKKKMVERAISSAIYGFAMADNRGCLTYVNPAFLQMWGYQSSEEVIGKHSTFFWKDADAAEKIIKELETNDGTFDELIAIKKDGTEFPVQLVASSFVFEQGQPPCLMSSFIDITEQKEAERILRENKKKLEEKNIAKDKFLSIIAHDLRNPFNSIIGFSELLERSIDNEEWEEYKRYARIIKSEAKSTLNLLDNLLNWARSQAGRIAFNPEMINFKKLILKSINLLKHSAESKNIFINYQLPANLIVYADKNMLNTVVRNLISNAIKFTNEGGMIYIEADSDKSNLKVAVSDTGIGLKKSEISKLFRIESEFSRKGTNNEGGTGLGLILCKEFIEKHNGEIWVESEYRNGSTFHFSIPVNPDN